VSLLNLPACPICYAKDSQCRQEMDRAGIPFTWYQCRECGSVLLWLGRDHWTYQKIGREDKAYLLKQPLTVDMLLALIDLQDEDLEAPAPTVQAGAEEPDVDPELAALAVQAVPAEELDAVPEPLPLEIQAVPIEEGEAVPEAPAPLPEKEKKGISRWLVLALAVVGLCFVCAVAGVLAGMPAIDRAMSTVVAGVEGTLAPQDTASPSETKPPANRATATDKAVPPTDTPRPAASATPVPTATAIPPTVTPVPTDTPPLAATATALPPTDTPVATDTPPPTATATPVPTATAIPPTAQPAETPVARMVIASVNRTTGWVEVKNEGSAPRYLAGWALVWEQANRRCALGGVLQSRQTIRVWAEAKDVSQGGINCGFDAPAWDNGSDPVVLYNRFGQEVDRK
jgi:hypothetical protein